MQKKKKKDAKKEKKKKKMQNQAFCLVQISNLIVKTFVQQPLASTLLRIDASLKDIRLWRLRATPESVRCR